MLFRSRAKWRAAPSTVRHVFTHFALELAVMTARTAARGRHVGQWTDDPLAAGLPTVMRKVVEAASG